jgi:hypothetical protein
MEDKWDIYLYRPYLYLARSWTGNLIYRALTHFADDSSSIAEIAYDQSANENPEFAVCAVDFLLKSHVLGLVVASPLPPGAPRDPEDIARYSFSEYGRNTAFATFADTRDLEPLAPANDAE